MDGNEYLGRLAIRHRSTDQLRQAGGHVSHDVQPSYRRRGHATAMLKAALPVARTLGIRTAPITCNIDNVASRKVIEHNGGVLQDGYDGRFRFWSRPLDGFHTGRCENTTMSDVDVVRRFQPSRW